MAKVQIADVIVPEVFADYVTMRTAELSAIRQSGIAAGDPAITERASGGGYYVNMPFWNDLDGDDEVLSDSGSLTPAKITAESDVAVKLFRGKAWSANDLAGWIAGDDPMISIANGVAAYWARKEQTTLINLLTGVFATTLSATHVHDVTGASTALSADVILDAKQLLGDAADNLTAIVMHSAKYTALQKANLISYLRDSDAGINFPTYLGYRVIVDDGCPVSTGNYTTYLFGAGAIGYADVPIDTGAETDRDSLAGDDILISRRGMVMHPRGVAYQTAAGANPTNAVLATGTTWSKVYDDKQIRMVKLVTK